MEWRQQSSTSCVDAFSEARRWLEEVTRKSFASNDFRVALENGVLLCDLINQLKPGLIKRMNRLSTPIAGLDNVNVFLKACGKLGLNEAQLFHPGDLQDLSTRVTLRREESNRRLKNVLITIYWLGRKAQLDPFYSGPQLNFKAFEGLLGLALSKALDEGSSVCVKDSGYRERWYPERGKLWCMRPGYRREDSVDSVDSVDSRALRTGSEGCGSDAEAEQEFRMEDTQLSAQQNKAYIPPPLLQRKQGQEENGRGCPGLLTRSKSLSDIPMHKVPARNTVDVGKDIDTATQCKREHPEKSRARPKDGEAKWQADLTKWKIRRRSTNSDLHRKLQDREHVINQMTNGARTSLRGNGTQGRLPKRDLQSTSSHNPALSSSSTSPTSKSSCSDLRPHTRALLARSYTTEALFSPTAPYSPHNLAHTEGPPVGAMPASDPTILGGETHYPFLASDGVTTPSMDCPFSSQTQVKSQTRPTPLQVISRLGQPGNDLIDQISSPLTTTLPNEILAVTCTNDFTAAVLNSPISVMTSGPGHQELSSYMDPKDPTGYPGPINQATVDALQHLSQEEAQQRSRQVVVEHSRDQQRTGLYRYSSRTGSLSGSASLPRGYRRSEGSSRLSVITARPFGTKPSRVSSLPRQYSVDDNKTLLLNSEKDRSLQPTRYTLNRQFATSQVRGQFQASIIQDSANQEAKETGGKQREKGRRASHSFQTNGHHYPPYSQTKLLPQPYSNLQSHHGKSLTLPSNIAIEPPEVHYSDMRVSLSLKPNSRPDFGFQTHWDSTGARVKSVHLASPAELCQLCVGDDIVAVDGVAVAHMSYDQWNNTMTSALQTGCLTMDIRRYGNKETTAMKASQFNGQALNGMECKGMDGEFADNPKITSSRGGSDSAISDLQVPSLSPSLSSWSWDHEEERRRQERWQEEQERLLQEQYQRDQVRLEAEWRRAQQDAMVEEYRKPENTFEITSGVVSPASTRLPVNGMTNQNREDEWSPDREELKEAAPNPQRDEQGAQPDKTKEHWAEGSCDFSQLSTADRVKSKSTPALTGLHKQTTGDQKKRTEQCTSKAEQDRQQILEEMKKRTQLLTDNSWIRQRSSSMYKEPIYIGVPLKRHESLDNIHTSWHQSPISTTTAGCSRPNSAAAGYSEPGRKCSSRYSMGANLSQKQASWTMDSSSASPIYFTPGDESAGQSLQQCGSVSTAPNISEEPKQESRFGSETGNPTVSPAISNSSPPLPPLCDQNSLHQMVE